MHQIRTKLSRYPESRRSAVVEDYHGTLVPDPYRWLEEPDSAETRAWARDQNELTTSLLAAVPARVRIGQRLAEIWDFQRVSSPLRRGARLFFTRNDGLQDQSVLYWQPGEAGEESVLLDPNVLSEDGTIALTTWEPSPDGAWLAYGVSSSGSDWQTVHVRHVETGRDLPDVIRWCKFTNIAWHRDGSGFAYCRFSEPGSVPEDEQFSYNLVYWHMLETGQEQDALVFATPEVKDFQYWPFSSEEGDTLLLAGSRGTNTENVIYARPMNGGAAFTPMIDGLDASYIYITNVGRRYYFRTNLAADAGRIIAVDLDKPQREHWREIVQEQDAAIAFAVGAGRRLVVAYLKDASHVLKVFDLEGQYLHDVPLPGLGALQELSGRLDSDAVYFTFASFLVPPTVYRYDLRRREREIFAAPDVDFDASAFETRQVFFTSRDGTPVPMFITHRKGLQLDGNNPTILYGYGGFNISVVPSFWVSRTVWLEDGGVFAVANLRGGEEYGESWHRAGMLDRKQNVFDDFIGAAETLIAHGYTSPGRLAINGRSNGGLLVAACMVQRPELYGAVVSTVPVIDMLRYHRFTIGRYWTGEYGNAEENADHFDFLLKYSPLHNVRDDVIYPPLLLTTAETDDRVVPAHAMKFAATLQAARGNDQPVLIRIEARAGHGLGKPTAKLIEEEADILAFLYDVLGVDE